MQEDSSLPSTDQRQPSITAIRLALLLGLVSFATVVFVLCIFRLLSFFIMPSMFFDLLFIGFPVGAFLGSRLFGVSLNHFARTLVLLQLVMLASVALCLLCKQADYLRASFYNLRTVTLLLQMGSFAAMFLPFFVTYGLSEYVGYQVGRRVLAGRMRAVYAAYLFGAAAAYFGVVFGLSLIGVCRLMVLGIAMVVLAGILISRRRLLLYVELAALLAACGWPGLEPWFLDLYKGAYSGSSIHSTKGTRAEGDWSEIYQRWGKYALCEVLEAGQRQRAGQPFTGQLSAFYNDVFQWAYYSPHGIPRPTLDALPFFLVPPDGRVAVIGAGGGRQVRWASEFPIREIVAVEIEPEVFRITNRFKDKFDNVYGRDNVTPICSEGRTFLEHHTQKFDLIFMPSVGGYPQMMLEPGNLIRTLEAYQLMRERLTANGVLAVWYPQGLDRDGILTRQYIDTLRSLGLTTTWYVNVAEILILASPDPARVFLPDQAVLAFFAGQYEGLRSSPVPDEYVPRRVAYEGNPEFTPITDNKPFLAGNVRNIFSSDQVRQIFSILGGAVVLLGIGAVWMLRRSGNPRIPGVPFALLVLLSLMVGANFLVMEHVIIVALYRHTFVFYDSLVIGAISFLVLTGLGSLAIRGRNVVIAYGVFVLSLLALVASVSLPAWVTVAASLPAVIVLGSFFPALFEAAHHNPLTVFALDAIGAALGSLCAFFVPIMFGLHHLFTLGAILGLCTVSCMAVFSWRTRDGASQPL